MISPDLATEADALLAGLRRHGFKLATAESCTGGLIAAVMTEIAGSSDVFERGFVTYSNTAKIGQLGVDLELLQTHGAVSAEVAEAMADGARRNSAAEVTLAVTGIAGPAGGTDKKPVGLVYLGHAWPGRPTVTRELRLGDIGRAGIRWRSVREALAMLRQSLEQD